MAIVWLMLPFRFRTQKIPDNIRWNEVKLESEFLLVEGKCPNELDIKLTIRKQMGGWKTEDYPVNFKVKQMQVTKIDGKKLNLICTNQLKVNI